MGGLKNILFHMWIILLWFPPGIFAQLEIQLPVELHILVNDTVFEPPESWTDSLLSEAQNGYIKYEIVSSWRTFNEIQTKIRVPQFFDFRQVIRQIILYYGLLNDEGARRRERLLIYPFFSELSKDPAAKCRYIKDGWYQITFNSWERIDVPHAPGPEAIYLYNQLLESSKQEFADRDGISEEVLGKVAAEHNMSANQLLQIYEAVKLWRLSE